MSGSDLLNLGTSGLLAYQRTLNTISHNIANVNTDGYSRQTVQLTANTPQTTGFGFTGTGVSVETIRRSYDAYLEQGMRTSTTAQAEFETFHSLAAQLDSLVADADVGMSTAMQRFFTALQDVADSPADTTARQVLLNEGEQLSQQFNQLHAWIDNVRDHVNTRLRTGAAEINSIGASIADLNGRIVLEEGRAGGQPANDLRDQRDALLLELSNFVSVTTLQQDDGAVNVMIGKGQPLVVGINAYQLSTSTAAGDPQKLTIMLDAGGGVASDITAQLNGGELGGAIAFRDRLLDPSLNSLGLTAVGMATLFNEQHRQGMDLDGALGTDFFDAGQPLVIAVSGAIGNAVASIDDVTRLTAHDYTLRYTGGAWGLTRNDTGQAVAMTGTGTAADPFIVDGLSIEVTPTPVNGEVYEIRPTRNAARDIDTVLANGRQIAAAAPVRSMATIGNTGSGSIGAGAVTDIGNAAFQAGAGQLSPPLLISFTAGNSYDIYDNTNPAAPVLLEAGIAYDPATGGELLPTPGALDYGYRMRIKGAPVAGDTFSVDYNAGGIGDNRNMLLLGGLADRQALDNGITSITDSYRNLVADVGISTRQAEQSSLAQGRVLQQVTASHDATSGVNLDEEAANLLRYQQAYQAAAQVIATASSLFDTLINAVRR